MTIFSGLCGIGSWNHTASFTTLRPMIVSSLSNDLSWVTTLAFTKRLCSDSAFVCPKMRADFIITLSSLYLFSPLGCSTSKTPFQNCSIHSSSLYLGILLSTWNNFHSSTTSLVLSLGCKNDESFSTADTVIQLFFFSALRHPSCLSNSFFSGNLDCNSVTVVPKNDRIPSITYFCWSCVKFFRAFLTSVPINMSFSGSYSFTSVHSKLSQIHTCF